MGQRFNAVAPTLPKPQKNRKGRDVKEYGPEEVHPSDAYNANIHNLIERPNSAPITKFRAPRPTNQQLTVANLTALNTGIPVVLASIVPATTATAGPAVAPLSGTLSDASTESGPDSAPDRVESMAFDFNHPRLLSFYPSEISLYRSAFMSAQGVFGPKARVVVGNLPKDFSDGRLSEIVQRAFREYGLCFAYVFRGEGKKGFLRPYAIVQYTEEQDAMAAFFCGQEKLIMGREVRVEISRRA